MMIEMRPGARSTTIWVIEEWTDAGWTAIHERAEPVAQRAQPAYCRSDDDADAIRDVRCYVQTGALARLGSRCERKLLKAIHAPGLLVIQYRGRLKVLDLTGESNR